MNLDYTKPIRLKTMGVIRSVTYLCHLRTDKGEQIAIMLRYSGEDCVTSVPPSHLENIPQSRWLNVCEYDGDIRVPASMWRRSRQECDFAVEYNGHIGFKRIAIIEDKQDGSPWILHQL